MAALWHTDLHRWESVWSLIGKTEDLSGSEEENTPLSWPQGQSGHGCLSLGALRIAWSLTRR